MANDNLVVLPDSDLATLDATVETLAHGLKRSVFVFEPDDVDTVATAETLEIDDAETYTRGYALLQELGALETRITTHYSRFDKPLNYLVNVVRALKKPQVEQVKPLKQALSAKLGAWKAAQEARDRAAREKAQQAADAAAQAAQAAKAAILERVAAQETDAKLQQSFLAEAAMVRAIEVQAAPVDVASSVPKVTDGFTRTTWRCEFVDLKLLMRTYVEGKCYIPDEALIENLQGFMDKQARNLGEKLGQAYPGTQAVPQYGAVTRRSRQ